MKVTSNQVKAVNSISLKISFTQQQLGKYFNGLKNGGNENSLLADVLGKPSDVEPLQFLTGMFTPAELTELKQALHEINPFVGAKPLAPAAQRTRSSRLGTKRV